MRRGTRDDGSVKNERKESRSLYGTREGRVPELCTGPEKDLEKDEMGNNRPIDSD